MGGRIELDSQNGWTLFTLVAPSGRRFHVKTAPASPRRYSDRGARRGSWQPSRWGRDRRRSRGARGRSAPPAGCTAGAPKTVVVRGSGAERRRTAAVVAAAPLVGNGFQPAQIYRSRCAGVVTVISYFASPDGSAGQGSGFVAAADGTVLTSAHVITTAGQGAERRRPRRPSGLRRVRRRRPRPGAVIGYDLYDDVGVLKVDPAAHAVAPVPLGDSSRVVVGQPVAAIGSPFGNVDSLSVGVVSAVRRSIPSLTSRYNLVDAIQTDAPINHGNSGGPLFDARGRVIGINAQIRSSGSASGFEGVGFAVPIDSAKRSLQQLRADRQGRVRLCRDHDRGPDAGDRARSSATRRARAP